jgi:hypothetical protein
MPVNIHGKEYLTVAERLDTFRTDKVREGWAIITEIIENDSDYVVIKATIKDEKDRTVATGHAQEKYGAGTINQTSALENCETSAIGRALACMGLAGTEFASADEVAGVIKQQGEGVKYSPNGKLATPKQKVFLAQLYEAESPDGSIVDYIKGEGFTPETLTSAQASKLIEELQGGK